MATQFFRQSDRPFKPVQQSVPPSIARLDASAEEVRRRKNLAASDELLNDIEELALADQRSVPDPLRDRIYALHAVIGKSATRTFRTVHAAHDFVFAMQHALLVANPRTSMPPSHGGRAQGQPYSIKMPVGGTWKLLSLPPVPEAGLTDEWFALVVATLERAWDRWAYAQHHAVTASRRHSRYARQAVARAVAAWGNYWQLLEEADRHRGL